MAKSENNEVMFGARGQVGNLVVFKNYYGRTIISKVRRKKDKTTSSVDQELVKGRFREGVYYAKNVLDSEVLSAFYKPLAKGPVTVFNLALADFCRPPEIKSINTEQYQGLVGNTITIRAIDNFRVVELKVTIVNLNGEVMETGLAEQAPNGVDWSYTVTVSNEVVVGTIVKARATDTPGNVTELEQTITG